MSTTMTTTLTTMTSNERLDAMIKSTKVRAAAAALSAALAISLEAAVPAKVAGGSVLAAYTNVGDCGRNAAITAYISELKSVFSGSELIKPCVDWLSENGYLDYSLYGEGWIVLSVGAITRPPDDAEKFLLPDIALAMYSEKRNPFDVAPIVKLWNERAPEKARTELATEVSVVRKEIAGAQVRELVFRDNSAVEVFPNFKVCWTRLFDNRLCIAALSEEALARQILLLRDGVGEVDASFEKLFAPDPLVNCKILIPHFGRTVSSLVREDELALLGTLPDDTPIADIVKNIGDVTYESVFEDTMTRNIFTVDFGSAETAQKLNGMMMALIVPLRQLADSADLSNPDEAFGAAVLKSIKSRVEGSAIKLSMEASWRDAIASFATMVPLIDELLVSIAEEDAEAEDADDEDADDWEDDAGYAPNEPAAEILNEPPEPVKDLAPEPAREEAPAAEETAPAVEAAPQAA